MIRSHDLLKTPLAIEPPHVRVPEGPGLGVEIDQEAVRHFKVSERTIQ
jgi:L-alanine-DL-glutamate epimerase-like enolase superfamily enzyme